MDGKPRHEGDAMFEIESLAGPVSAVHESLAEALAAALDAEMRARSVSFYTAIAEGALDDVTFLPARVA